MASWDPSEAHSSLDSGLHVMSTRDGNVTIDLASAGATWSPKSVRGIRVVGTHGGWSQGDGEKTKEVFRLMLLAGETVLLRC